MKTTHELSPAGAVAAANASETNLSSAPLASGNCPPHWWLIDTPNGALSAGRCKLCGAEGMFPNSGPGENLASWKDGGAGVLALRGTSLRRTRKGSA